mmetsp:Transcript_60418/g.118925  ORF Transcript_60418/g.118925 Transcript_60418/m.118925 type:complete len:134 (-) Transcript_60418:64-465(-)
MRAIEYFFNLCAVFVLGYINFSHASTEFHICSADDPLFLGTYTSGKELMDGVPIFSNANDMSFFRNKGFWYVGNLAPWPPETHYRCVEPEGCNYGLSFPPTTAEGAWKPAKKYDKGTLPVISNEPCVQSNDEL